MKVSNLFDLSVGDWYWLVRENHQPEAWMRLHDGKVQISKLSINGNYPVFRAVNLHTGEEYERPYGIYPASERFNVEVIEKKELVR